MPARLADPQRPLPSNRILLRGAADHRRAITKIEFQPPVFARCDLPGFFIHAIRLVVNRLQPDRRSGGQRLL